MYNTRDTVTRGGLTHAHIEVAWAGKLSKPKAAMAIVVQSVPCVYLHVYTALELSESC